jgi:8-oxo-dGTP pyrophosphatase MutT (NUDIX family)
VDIRNRLASRLLIIDRQNRVLLVQYEDENGKWWATPGGGVRDFESFENAALREACEELGLSGFPIQPLWQGINEFKSRGVHLRQTEQFFLIRADGSDVLVDAELAREHAIEGIIAIRWWSSDELRMTNERVFPVDLCTRIENIVRQPN